MVLLLLYFQKVVNVSRTRGHILAQSGLLPNPSRKVAYVSPEADNGAGTAALAQYSRLQHRNFVCAALRQWPICGLHLPLAL